MSRQLVLLRGAPGAGKSTFITKYDLTNYAVSPDVIRTMFSGIMMTPEGKMGINQDLDSKVWAHIDDFVERRMMRGEYTVIDGAFKSLKSMQTYLNLAKKHYYQVLIIDFYCLMLDTVKQQNKSREDFKAVPEEYLENCYAANEESKEALSNYIKANSHVKSVEITNLTVEALQILSKGYADCLLTDLTSKYRKIHHIGDIQGCHEPFIEYIKNGIDSEDLYIFVGDYLDRGIQNGEVLRTVMECSELPNVVMLWGNHENHLKTYAQKIPSLSPEFEENTLPQIKEAKISPEFVEKFCWRLKDYFQYYYNGQMVLVTHAGLSNAVKKPILIPSYQYQKGTGTYDYPVDLIWSDNVDRQSVYPHYQVHGHRNAKNLPVHAAKYSFNLEGKVEFGGHLRIATLDKTGWETIEIKNNIYRKDQIGRMSDEGLAKLANHPEIRVRESEKLPHVKSYFSSQKVFYDNLWDETTLKYRGLFLDQEQGIIARGYPKFFNLNENAETQWRQLNEKLVFPVEIYRKENGYLGLLGYDRLQGKLFFSSKTAIDSNFSTWFEEIFREKVAEKFSNIERFLKRENACMTFEVIDPIRDPHIIEYPESSLVLLDILKRSEEFEPYSSSETQTRGTKFGLRCKSVMKICNDFKELQEFVERITISNRPEEKEFEGLVIRDATNYMFKVKLPYYVHWKKMRTLLHRVRKNRLLTQNVEINSIDQQSIELLGFFSTLSDDEIEAYDIVTIRNEFKKWKKSYFINGKNTIE